MNLINSFISNSAFTEIIINIIILAVILIGCSIFLYKVKFESKSYKLLFINYILFWFSIMLIRDYRGAFQKVWDDTMLWLPLMIYGCVGIFARPIFDFFGLYLRNRKLIIYLALIIQFSTFLPITIVQNEATSLAQSIGIGIGASLIGNYEFLFKEQYGRSKSFLTVSILAFPPIIADFSSNPIQAIVESYAKSDSSLFYLDRMTILWIVALAIIPVTYIFTMFIKEDRDKVGYKVNLNQKTYESNTKKILLFASILLAGVIITFVKFSNSGSVGKLQLDKLFKFNNENQNASMSAYLSALFTIGQISGTFAFAMMINKNINKNIIFIIGVSVWLIYHIVSLFIYNPYVFFSIHIFNGFAYGLLYNLALGYVLSMSFKNKYITPMGIYQSVSAIGITCATWFTTYIKNNVLGGKDKTQTFDQFKTAVFTVDSVVIIALIILCALYAINYYYHDSKKRKLNRVIYI